MEDIFKMTDDWGDIRPQSEIVLYGMGRIGRRVLPTIMKQFKVLFIIDKNSSENSILGIKILQLPEAIKELQGRKIKIVITTVLAAYKEISTDLEKAGFREYIDFCHFERFAGEWNIRWRNHCVLSKIDTVITSRCTLKCKNCNMFIGHVDEPHDMSLQSLKTNFDIFFDSVDFVYEYTLLGGEPLLHNDLLDIISYLVNSYGEKIGRINLISNGTVLPDSKTLEFFAKYHVIVHISDYTASLGYEKRLSKVVDSLSKAGIEHYVIPNNIWKDVVYPCLDYHTDNPGQHMIMCGHSTHSVDNGRLYWCDPAFAAEYFTGFKPKSDDYLDLAKNRRENSKYEASLKILRYLLGDVNERGYMTICEKCAGVGKDNDREVRAGIQMKG